MRESRSASRALSVPVLNDSRSAKSKETTANDRLLHFMAQPPKVEKHGEFGVTSQFVIEVQPLFIRNSFQTVFCLRALVSIEIPFVQTEVGLEQDSPMSSATGSFSWRWMSQTCRITDSSRTSGHVRKVPERSPLLVRSSAARLPSVCKSRIYATIRKCPVGRSLALLVPCELTQPREAVLFTL
jgi:hypothetical protein